VDQALDMAGAHISWAQEAPSGFDWQLPLQTLEQYRDDQDLWLFAPDSVLLTADVDGRLGSWLAERNAIHFPEAGLFWIPAVSVSDRLAFLEEQQLLGAVDAGQRARLWRFHGDQLRLEGDFEGALVSYQQSVKLAPSDPETLAGAGAAFLALGRNEEAVAPLQTALESDPNHYWAHRLLGTAYLNLQRYQFAADELTQAYLLQPDDPSLLAPIALALGRSGQSELALRILNQLDARATDTEMQDVSRTLRQEFTSP